MNQQEREQLTAVIETLQGIQTEAPDKTTYTKGRTGSSIAYRLLDVIRDLKGLVGDDEREAEPE